MNAAASSLCSHVSSTETPLYGDSPSGLSGIPWEREQRKIRELCSFVRETGLKLQLPPWTITTAFMICHRFYQTHSLDENDRFIIGVASLYLAGKIQNTVKSPLEVISNGWEVNSRGNPAESGKLSHINFLNDLRRYMMQAEELLLVAIDFEFDFPMPCAHAMKLLMEEFGQHSSETRLRLNGLTMKLLDHMMMSTLSVNFKAESLAAVALSIACSILELPVDRSKIWKGAELERADELVDEVFALYREAYLDSSAESTPRINPFITQRSSH